MGILKKSSAEQWRKIFGQNVRRLRVEQGFSQKELGQKANEVFSGNGKGLTQGNISALERGAIDPPMMTVMALAKALGTSPEQLYPSGDEEDLDEEVVAERLERLKQYMEANESSLKKFKYVLSELTNLRQWLIEDFPENTSPEDMGEDEVVKPPLKHRQSQTI